MWMYEKDDTQKPKIECPKETLHYIKRNAID